MGGDCGPLSREKKLGKAWIRRSGAGISAALGVPLHRHLCLPQLVTHSCCCGNSHVDRPTPKLQQSGQGPCDLAMSPMAEVGGGTTMKGVPSLNVDFRREVFLAQATSRRTYNETFADPFFFHSRRKGAQVGKGAQNRGRWCEALSKNLLPIRTSTVPHIQLGLCTRGSRCRN